MCSRSLTSSIGPGWWSGWMVAGGLTRCWGARAGRIRTWTWSSTATTPRRHRRLWPGWDSATTGRSCPACRPGWSWSTGAAGRSTCIPWSSTSTATAGRTWAGTPGVNTRPRASVATARSGAGGCAAWLPTCRLATISAIRSGPPTAMIWSCWPSGSEWRCRRPSGGRAHDEGRRAPGVLAGLGGCRKRRLPSGSHGPVRATTAGGRPRGPAEQPADQRQQGDGDQVDVTAGGGRDRLGGDGDHGRGAELALAGPDPLDRGLGPLGRRGLDAAQQPVVLVLGRGRGGDGAGLALQRPGPLDGGLGAGGLGAGGLHGQVVLQLGPVQRLALPVEVLGGRGDGGGGGDERQAQRQGGERPVGAAHGNLLLVIAFTSVVRPARPGSVTAPSRPDSRKKKLPFDGGRPGFLGCC